MVRARTWRHRPGRRRKVTAEGQFYPPAATGWAPVHAAERDFEPLGAAVLFAADRVLTCAHVVVKEGTIRDSLWVAFPNADGCPRLMVASSELVYEPPTRGTAVRDLAALVLSEPVPA